MSSLSYGICSGVTRWLGLNFGDELKRFYQPFSIDANYGLLQVGWGWWQWREGEGCTSS